MIICAESDKGLWCPFSRVLEVDSSEGDSVGAAVNRNLPQAFTQHTLCKKDDCMAWRWCEGQEDTDTFNGYCGLAGKPAC
jgi:hypothetical protein